MLTDIVGYRELGVRLGDRNKVRYVTVSSFFVSATAYGSDQTKAPVLITTAAADHWFGKAVVSLD